MLHTYDVSFLNMWFLISVAMSMQQSFKSSLSLVMVKILSVNVCLK